MPFEPAREEKLAEEFVAQGESLDLLITQLRDQKRTLLTSGAGFTGKYVLYQNGVEVLDNTVSTELAAYSSAPPHTDPGNGAVIPALTAAQTAALDNGGYTGVLRIFNGSSSYDLDKRHITIGVTLPDESTSV